MKTYIQNGHMVRVTAPVGGIIAGDCIIVGSIFGVAAITSVENDPVWRDAIQKALPDGRLHMLDVTGPVAAVVTPELLHGADLILVDDSTCAMDRAATARAVSAILPPDAILVIHDFEVPDYQAASRELSFRFVSDALLPNTGILARSELLCGRWCRQFNRLIEKHRDRLQPTDLAGWQQLFARLQ